MKTCPRLDFVKLARLAALVIAGLALVYLFTFGAARK